MSEHKTVYGKQYDGIIFIGRFQPVHHAHLEIIKHARKIAEKVVIVVGSAKHPRTIKNPWTARERIHMVQTALNETVGENVYHNPHFAFEENIDTIYNDQAWAIRIQEIATKHIVCTDRNSSSRQPKIGIIGHRKPGDNSTYYLDMFPQWDFVDVDHNDAIDATVIRDLYFKENQSTSFLKGVVTDNIYQFLEKWKDSLEYKRIIEEKKFIETYKSQFASLKYAPTFVTADSVVVQAGHVLMIKRKEQPGQGLWALPGGFLNATDDKSMQDCAIRELREETGLKVPNPVLAGNIKDSEVFDAVNRSARGRTITHAFHIELPAGELPRVRGSDDADKAQWIQISELDSENCFEDHYEIIQHFIGIE